MLKNIDEDNKCKKCSMVIDGRSYYVSKLDCIYDGKNLFSCDSVLLCSDCDHSLIQWPQI